MPMNLLSEIEMESDSDLLPVIRSLAECSPEILERETLEGKNCIFSYCGANFYLLQE
jgi:hypothetical protein